MKIPRHWTMGEYRVTGPNGEPKVFQCWGWSATSVDDARRVGEERARRSANAVIQNRIQGSYLYSDRPLREAVLDELADPRGQCWAVITRNALGCDVLNTASVLFVDIDLEKPGVAKTLVSGVKRLFGRGNSAKEDQAQQQALSKIEAASQGMRVRVYRTFAGLRCLFTSQTFDPLDERTQRLMHSLEADPLYQKLCQVQGCFRARLTPKPWRCGTHAPAQRYPFSSPAEEADFQLWHRQYLTASEPYGTCKLVAEFGSAPAANDITPLVELHDRLTRAESGLPLA